MISSQKAQSILEYAAIATFVMIGIFISGPYVVRAINSHFTNIEDGIRDSFEEELTQSPLGADLPTCECTDPVDHGCGNGLCNQYQKHYTISCTPLGCEETLSAFGIDVPLSYCEWDVTCCNPWRLCGPVVRSCCGVNAVPECPDDTIRQVRECGDPDPYNPTLGTTQQQSRCTWDARCIFRCSIPNLYGRGAVWCNAATCCTRLTGPTSTTFVATGTCGANPPKCRAQCLYPLYPSVDRCLCPPPFVYNAPRNACICPAGTVYVDSCPGGTCAQTSGGINCGAGRCRDSEVR